MIDPNELHVTTDLQALITGMMIGAVAKLEEMVAIHVEFPPDDENGIHRPYFDLVGKVSGTRVRVMVVTIE